MTDLVVDNLKLVGYVIKKMNLTNYNDYEDYYQIGVLGLMYAAKTFNKEFQTTFSTYAYVCIKNEILKYLKKSEINCVSLDEIISNGIQLQEVIEDKNNNIIETIILNESNEILYETLKKELADLEYQVIIMSFGIKCNALKQKDIADILNIQQYKVSRVKRKALDKIKNSLAEYF